MRLSAKHKPNEESPQTKITNLIQDKGSPNNPEIDPLKPIINKLHELFGKIRKSASFHKAVSINKFI